MQHGLIFTGDDAWKLCSPASLRAKGTSKASIFTRFYEKCMKFFSLLVLMHAIPNPFDIWLFSFTHHLLKIWRFVWIFLCVCLKTTSILSHGGLVDEKGTLFLVFRFLFDEIWRLIGLLWSSTSISFWTISFYCHQPTTLLNYLACLS